MEEGPMRLLITIWYVLEWHPACLQNRFFSTPNLTSFMFLVSSSQWRHWVSQFSFELKTRQRGKKLPQSLLRPVVNFRTLGFAVEWVIPVAMNALQCNGNLKKGAFRSTSTKHSNWHFHNLPHTCICCNICWKLLFSIHNFPKVVGRNSVKIFPEQFLVNCVYLKHFGLEVYLNWMGIYDCNT